MRNFLIAILFMFIAVPAQAGATGTLVWHETNDTYLLSQFPDVFDDTRTEIAEPFNYVAGTYTQSDGVSCEVFLTKWYNESRYTIGNTNCGGGGGAEALLQRILDELRSQDNPWDKGK